MADSIIPFLSSNEEVYIKYNNGRYQEIHPVRSSRLKQIIGAKYYREKQRALDRDSHEKIRDHYSAMAYQAGIREPVYTRTTLHDNILYYDLANEYGEIVKITPHGWEIITNPPINFIRSKSMLPSIKPVERNASLYPLRQHLGIQNDEDFYLVVGFILGALYKPPHVILIHNGEQGTGKSTKSKMIASIIDPSSPPLISKPNSERDVFIAASKTHLMSYDNLSGLKPWASDTFCILATGGGYRTRMLYSDDEEKIFNVAKPIQMNGIDDIATRGDLIDRSIILSHPVIPSTQRIPESEIWQRFNNDLPEIMGGVFNALSTGLRNIDSINIREIPRMADFAMFACAASESFGATPETFMQAYKNNLLNANRTSLELNPISIALIEFINDRSKCPNMTWEGTMTRLREELLFFIPLDLHSSSYIPKTPQALSNSLKRLSPMLKGESIHIERLPRASGARNYKIFKERDNDNRDDSDN